MFCHGKMVMEKLHFLESELLIWSQLCCVYEGKKAVLSCSLVSLLVYTQLEQRDTEPDMEMRWKSIQQAAKCWLILSSCSQLRTVLQVMISLLGSFDKANSEVTRSPKVPEEPASSSSYESLANLCAAATMSCHVNRFQKITRILPSHSMNLENQEMIVHGSRHRRSMLCLSEQEFADVWLQLSST